MKRKIGNVLEIIGLCMVLAAVVMLRPGQMLDALKQLANASVFACAWAGVVVGVLAAWVLIKRKIDRAAIEAARREAK